MKDNIFKLLEEIFGRVFEDEPIPQRPQTPRSSSRPATSGNSTRQSGIKLPPALAAARSLANDYSRGWQSREALFLQQAKLLEKYEDDFQYSGTVSRYFSPTYEELSNGELRAYFSWRTKLRRGQAVPFRNTFFLLHAYELMNQVGVRDPLDGLRKLEQLFRWAEGEDPLVPLYQERWLPGYVAYYGLEPKYLPQTPEVTAAQDICLLEDIANQKAEAVIPAVKRLCPGYLERSKFYRNYAPDMDWVIVQVLRRTSVHYATRCKSTMTEQFFGPFAPEHIYIFGSAVFCDPLKRKNYQYAANARYLYICKNGRWTLHCHTDSNKPSSRLRNLLKTIDCVMRETWGYKNPIKPGLETKWLLKAIREEALELLAAKKAAEATKKEREKLHLQLDPARLERIRLDAAVTRDRLIVEEETLETLPAAPEPPKEAAPEAPPEASALPGDCPLEAAEYRLLQSLLYGRSLDWVRGEGYLMSVLVDGINEKLYDTFLDSVVLLEAQPQVIEDYIEELKEMILP